MVQTSLWNQPLVVAVHMFAPYTTAMKLFFSNFNWVKVFNILETQSKEYEKEENYDQINLSFQKWALSY